MTKKFSRNELDNTLATIMDKHIKTMKSKGYSESDLIKEFAILKDRQLTQLQFKHFPDTMRAIKEGEMKIDIIKGVEVMLKSDRKR